MRADARGTAARTIRREMFGAWLVLAGLAIGPAAAAEGPGTVVLDDLSFRRGTLTIAVPHLEAHGTALTAAELRDILDPASPLPLRERLARLTADAVSAPEVVFRRDPGAGEAEGQVVTLHDVRLTGVVDGKAAALSVASLDGSLRSGAAERDAVSTAAITAHALDPSLALEAATGSRADEAMPVATVCGDLAISGLRLSTAAADTLAVDAIELAGLRARPLRDTPSTLVHLLGVVPGTPSAADKARLTGLLVDAAASAALDRFSISGLAFAGTDASGSRVSFRLGRIAVSDLRPASLGRLDIGDASLDGAGAHVALHSALALNLGGSTALNGWLAQAFVAAPPAPTLVRPAPLNSDVRVEGLEIDVPSPPDGPLPPGTMNRILVPLTEAGASTSPDGKAVESHAEVKLLYDMPAGGTDPTLQLIRDLGFGRLDASFGYRMTYDVEAGAMRLDEFALAARDIGSVALSSHLAGLPAAAFGGAATPDAALAALAGARFGDVSVTVVDHGLLDRVLSVMARQSGTAPALLRAGLKAQVYLHLPDLLGSTPTEAAVAAAIERFLDAGGTLAVEARSPGGLTFREIAAAPDPASLAREVDITAVAHP